RSPYSAALSSSRRLRQPLFRPDIPILFVHVPPCAPPAFGCAPTLPKTDVPFRCIQGSELFLAKAPPLPNHFINYLSLMQVSTRRERMEVSPCALGLIAQP